MNAYAFIFTVKGRGREYQFRAGLVVPESTEDPLAFAASWFERYHPGETLIRVRWQDED